MTDDAFSRAAEGSGAGSVGQAGGPGKPLLAVDVDGVVSLFGFEGPAPQGAEYRMQLVDGVPHLISLAVGRRLERLCGTFEMVWATGWEDKANMYLPNLLGLSECPHVCFDAAPRTADAHWKLPALERYAAGRALAWVDDSLDPSCFEWVKRRPEPTLLVPTEPQRGLEEAHVAALEDWVRDLD